MSADRKPVAAWDDISGGMYALLVSMFTVLVLIWWYSAFQLIDGKAAFGMEPVPVMVLAWLLHGEIALNVLASLVKDEWGRSIAQWRWLKWMLKPAALLAPLLLIVVADAWTWGNEESGWVNWHRMRAEPWLPAVVAAFIVWSFIDALRPVVKSSEQDIWETRWDARRAGEEQRIWDLLMPDRAVTRLFITERPDEGDVVVRVARPFEDRARLLIQHTALWYGGLPLMVVLMLKWHGFFAGYAWWHVMAAGFVGSCLLAYVMVEVLSRRLPYPAAVLCRWEELESLMIVPLHQYYEHGEKASLKKGTALVAAMRDGTTDRICVSDGHETDLHGVHAHLRRQLIDERASYFGRVAAQQAARAGQTGAASAMPSEL